MLSLFQKAYHHLLWFLFLVAMCASAAPMANGVQISWMPVDGASGYHIQISRSVNFNTPVLETDEIEARFSWQPPSPGRYYFRVATRNRFKSLGSYSEPSLILVRGRGAVLNIEKSGLKLSASEATSIINWRSARHARGYVIELRKKDGEIPIHRAELAPSATEWRLPAISPGVYKLRLVTQFGNGVQDEVSPWRAIEVVPGVPKIQLVAPTHDEKQIVPLGKTFVPVEFQWKIESGACAKYVLELYSTLERTKAIKTHLTSNTMWNVELAAHRYLWRVGCKDNQHEEAWTTLALLEIERAPPSIVQKTPSVAQPDDGERSRALPTQTPARAFEADVNFLMSVASSSVSVNTTFFSGTVKMNNSVGVGVRAGVRGMPLELTNSLRAGGELEGEVVTNVGLKKTTDFALWPYLSLQQRFSNWLRISAGVGFGMTQRYLIGPSLEGFYYVDETAPSSVSRLRSQGLGIFAHSELPFGTYLRIRAHRLKGELQINDSSFQFLSNNLLEVTSGAKGWIWNWTNGFCFGAMQRGSFSQSVGSVSHTALGCGLGAQW